jgi:hypothetical protein
MTLRNVAIDGVTLLSGNPEGITNTVSTTTYGRKAFLVTGHVTAFTTSDTAGMTGINTAIAAAERNGRTLTLISVTPCLAGASADATPITAYLTATANAALTIANSTTTGDATTGILGDSAGTAITTIVGPMYGIGVIAVVDETPPS